MSHWINLTVSKHMGIKSTISNPRVVLNLQIPYNNTRELIKDVDEEDNER